MCLSVFKYVFKQGLKILKAILKLKKIFAPKNFQKFSRPKKISKIFAPKKNFKIFRAKKIFKIFGADGAGRWCHFVVRGFSSYSLWHKTPFSLFIHSPSFLCPIRRIAVLCVLSFCCLCALFVCRYFLASLAFV